MGRTRAGARRCLVRGVLVRPVAVLIEELAGLFLALPVVAAGEHGVADAPADSDGREEGDDRPDRLGHGTMVTHEVLKSDASSPGGGAQHAATGNSPKVRPRESGAEGFGTR